MAKCHWCKGPVKYWIALCWCKECLDYINSLPKGTDWENLSTVMDDYVKSRPIPIVGDLDGC